MITIEIYIKNCRLLNINVYNAIIIIFVHFVVCNVEILYLGSLETINKTK